MAVGEGYDAGRAWLQILPSFSGIEDELRKVAQKIADGLNKNLADAMPDGVKASAKATAKEAEKAGEQAGEKSAEKFAGHFADTLARRLRAAQRSLPTVVIDGDSSPFEKRLAKVRDAIADLNSKRLGVDLTPSEAIDRSRDISGRLRNLRSATPDERLRVDLSQAADEIDAWVEVAQAGGEKVAAEARRAGDEWNRIHQSALDENERRQRKAAEEFTRIWEHAHSEDLRRTHQILKQQGRIHEQAIEEDQKRDYLAARARAKLHEDALDEDVKRDWQARQQMAKLHEQAIAEDHKRMRRAAQDAARTAEQEFGKTWAGKIQAEIGRAFQALPDISMRPARDAAEQMVKDIRTRLETLRGQRIGIDIDAETALAEVAALRGELARLAHQRVNVQVQADVIDAAAKLTLVERMAERLEGRRIDLAIDADASKLDDIGRASNFALSRLEGLTFLALSLGTTIVPAAGAAAAAIGFIGTAAVSAAAGIGVLALGFSGVGDAVKAMHQLNLDSQKSAVAFAQAEKRVADATASVESAQRSLANTRANAAESARRSAQQVADAERSVGEARRDAAEAIRAANERLAGAERDKTRAEVDAREAREGLTRAYRDAASAMADLNSQVKRNSLDQRQATLDLAEARTELDKILVNPKATAAEREQARITYERRVQQITDLKRQGKELAEQQADANRKGVQGSDQVVAARRRIADADRRVADAQRGVDNARRAVVKAQVDGAQRVADAERRVSQARSAQAQQQRQSAFQIVQAQQGVISAQRQLDQAIEKTSVAGGEAYQNLQDAMDQLSPSGQRFAKFLYGLKPALDDLRATTAENLLPGVQASIENLLPYLPRFQGYMGRAANAVGGLFDQATKLMTTDATWRRFWGYTDAQTVPTLERLYRITSNTATGLIGLFLAFTPFNDDIGGGLEKMTADFARWSASLDQNQGFQKMLGYIRENGPAVLDLLGQMIQFVVRFVEAAAPIGSAVVSTFDALFTVINLIPLPILQALVMGIAGLSLVILGLNSAMRLAEIRRATFAKIGDTFDTVRLAGMLAADRVSEGMDRIADRSDRAGRAMGRLRSAGQTMRSGLSRVADFITGPWGIALAGAGLAIDYLASKQSEQKQKVKDLSTALGLLGDAYKQTGSIASSEVRNVVAQNEELEDLINNANQYGVAIRDVADAATGNEVAQQRVIATLTAKREALRQAALAESAAGAESGISSTKYDEQYKAIGTLIGALEDRYAKTNSATAAQKLLNKAQADNTAAADPAHAAQQRLGDAIKVLASRTATAAEKMQALKAAEDALYGGARSQIEAEEAYEAALDNVQDALTRKNNSLDVGTAAGRANRDAVQALLEKSVEMYNADRAAGVGVEEATRRHNKRIDALRKEAHDTGVNKGKLDELIGAYGKVPEEVETMIKMTGDPEVDAKLKEFAIQQKMLEKGISFSESKRLYEKDKRLAMMASGGLLRGPGTGTSDDILLWGSNGEFMQRASAVDYYGVDFMNALNLKRIPKEALPGFAGGGLISRWPFDINVSKTKIPSPDAGVVRSSGGIGSADMMTILRRAFPGLALLSGYRPGSRTNNGSLSYHGRIAKDGDKGRAVDVPPRMDVFNWLTRNYPDSREIIFTPAGARQVWNGRPHVFQDPFVRRTHFNHVHWAYDQGGYLPPGVSTVFNGTGKPEPVFTDSQFGDIAAMVQELQAGGGRGGEIHHWHFKEAALDHGRLQAWADRRDALARPGRRR
ncbi:hypothetical protein ABZY58_11800 [Micromonospora tulbaghiae]|uniref:hypothetical protein n=1 Tax=Micromonospora tulbaghiae TaxID=479978 RepID=UPI0033A06517